MLNATVSKLNKVYLNTQHLFSYFIHRINYFHVRLGNDHLTEIHLIEIVFFSVDRNFHNQLIEFFETIQLIEKFDQVPKNNLRILAVDRKF